MARRIVLPWERQEMLHCFFPTPTLRLWRKIYNKDFQSNPQRNKGYSIPSTEQAENQKDCIESNFLELKVDWREN